MSERVSVIIPVYNGSRYLAECLDSVLAQTRPPTEVIVVDDGSTDDSGAIAGRYGSSVRVLRQENRGQAAALSAGLAAASGDMLAFNDADDLWTPAKLALQLAHLGGRGDLEISYGLTEQFVSPELDDDAQRRFAPANAVLPGRIFQAALIRRSAFDRVGGVNPSLRGAGCADWIARAQSCHIRQDMLAEIVHRRRLHSGNYGRTHVAERDQNLLSVLRSQIVRRRGGSDSRP